MRPPLDLDPIRKRMEARRAPAIGRCSLCGTQREMNPWWQPMASSLAAAQWTCACGGQITVTVMIGGTAPTVDEDLFALLAEVERIRQPVPDEWEGDFATEHPNRCRLRDFLLNSLDRSPAWRCHKRAGHDGPCSCHNDCGVMSGGVVCGKLPNHVGPHAWATEIT
jgi:hypothetical protein